MKGLFWPRPHSSPQGSCCRCLAVLEHSAGMCWQQKQLWGKNALIGKPARLTSILRMMSNPEPSTWTRMYPGDLWVMVVVCAAALLLAKGEGIRKVAFPFI